MTARPAIARAAVLPATVVIVAAMTVACRVAGSSALPEPASARPTAVFPSLSTSVSSPPPEAQVPLAALTTSFTELQQVLDGSAGIAVAPVGSQGSVYTFGDWSTGPAWSTSKVILVLAAMRMQPGAPLSADMSAAITDSDNNAAEHVWEGLGEPETAASKMTAVLREAGDPTVVPSHRVRPDFSVFGQTIWSLDRQARFLAQAGCDPRSAGVLDLMGQIDSRQRWGLGVIPDAQFKGGWGPAPTGEYLVRQFGLVPTDRGTIAVAVAAVPASGSFASGVDMLDTMTRWISEHTAEMPVGQCD